MGIPASKLNSEQTTWYAKMMIAAILADEEVSASEIGFLKHIADMIKDPEEKKALLSMISNREKPAVYVPENTSKELLAAVYLELISIIISDQEFTREEQQFLDRVAKVFDFSPKYKNELMKWAESGLQLNEQKRRLLPNNSQNVSIVVPVDKLNSEQKTWYASMLVAAVMLDGEVDKYEQAFLKVALNIVENKTDRQRLSGHIRNKIKLPITGPPDMPMNVLIAVMVEIIQILAVDEAISVTEHSHLQRLARLCQIPPNQFDIMLEWCNRSIRWKKSRSSLIGDCSLNSRKTKIGPRILVDNPDNSSIQNRYYHCFVCESPDKFPAFFLRPLSQESRQNIFGITTYQTAAPGFDFIDYNLVNMIICPNCFFASKEKSLFRKSPADKPPEILDEAHFRRVWLKEIEKRRRFFTKPEEITSLNRSLLTVVNSFKMAIEIAKKLGELKKNDAMRWEVIHLLMVLSEILVSNNRMKEGLQTLNDACIRAKSLFDTTVVNSISFKCARLLILFGLYKGEFRVASPYLEFLRDLKLNKLDQLNQKDKQLLNKVFGEMKRAVENRSEYHKDHLEGFHRYC